MQLGYTAKYFDLKLVADKFLSRLNSRIGLSYGGISQHSFHRETPTIIFHIPRNPIPCKRSETRIQRQLAAHRSYFILPVDEQKIPRYFEGYSEVFALFQNLFLFIPQFLAEPQKMIYRTLVGKHCPTVTFEHFEVELHLYRVRQKHLTLFEMK
jgi:hypothetical protein